MSINRSAGLQLFQGELTVQRHKAVEIKFKKAKYSTEHLKGTKTGELYLTNFRLFFMNNKSNDMLQNVSVPFKLIKDFEIKQPVFGANFLEGKILAEEGGGWQGSVEFEMTFNAGGAVEVGQSLVKMAQNPQMMYMARPAPIIVTSVPIASVPIASVPSAPPGYGPPPAGYQPIAPPSYSPYPNQYQQPNGAGASTLPYPPQPQPYPTGDPKAQEAMASAASYLPPGYAAAPPHNPPSYYDASKKDQ